MAAGDNIQWWCRTDGDDSFGGGYDSGMPSAGTNYCDQATAQLTLTDLATSGAGIKTITSVTGGFTTAMIGNCIRIASGTNFTAGYYWIDGRTDTNTITVTVSPTAGGAGSGGSGKIGGAFLGLKNLMAGAQGGLSNPSITSPLAAGHRINLGGTGGDDPGTGGGSAPTGMDYDYRGSAAAYQGYWQPISGSVAAGLIKVVGYKQGGGTGRPCIAYSGLLVYLVSFWFFENIKAIMTHTGGLLTYGFGGSATDNKFVNVIVDVNGQDVQAITGHSIVDCEVRNTGSTTAGSSAGFLLSAFGGACVGCVAKDLRGDGFREENTGVFAFCIADTCHRDGFAAVNPQYPCVYINCTSYNCTGDGLSQASALGIVGNTIINLNLSDNGSNSVDCRVGTTVLNDKRRGIWKKINAYNSSTLYNAVTAPADALNVDPQFVSAAAGDLAVGTNLKAQGYPGLFRTGEVTSYVDIGAVQRQEPAAGGLLVGNSRLNSTLSRR